MKRGLYIAERADAALLRALSEMGYRVRSVRPREALWEIAEDDTNTFVVYDDADADIDHFAACAKAKPGACMMLAIAARSTVETRVALLRAGADVCISRPLSFLELEALLLVFFRRQLPAEGKRGALPPRDSGSTSSATLLLHRRTCKATYLGRAIQLSPREFRLLVLLAESAGHPLDRLTIWKKVWNEELELSSASIDLAASRLRQKLADTPVRIVGVRNVGYRLNGEFRIC